MDPDQEVPFFVAFLRATDDEIEAALKEHGADSTMMSVDLYKRAVPLLRSRQAASKAAKAAASQATSDEANHPLRTDVC